MAAQSIRIAAICLSLLYASLNVHAKDVAAWISDARAATTPEEFSTRHVVVVDDNCALTIREGDISTTATSGTVVTSIDLPPGKGTIVDFCAGSTKSQIFKNPDLFKNSAVWKVEGTAGYIEGDYLVECEAKGSRCCSMYFVPVTAGSYPAEIETCAGLSVPVTILPGTLTETLEQPEHPVVPDTDSDSAWDVDISLVFSPECGLGTPTTEGADGLYEGTGENESAEGADGIYEGTGESQLSPPEGADGNYEGTGESQSPPEGTDGNYEGTGESQSPPEGADGVYEGTGESMAPPPEGADGVYEGTGEGSTEGSDGVYEGTGESQSPPEGADGNYEGTGESQSPPEGRRLLAEEGENDATAVEYPGTKWFWSKGHTWNRASLIDPSAPDVEESAESGEGSRRLLRFGGSRSLLQNVTSGVPMFDATATPIELVVGRMYKINVNMVRAPKAAYFSAPDFFKACYLHHVEDAGVVVEYERLVRVEMAPGANYFAIEVQPMTAGIYTFTSSDGGSSDTGFTGTIKVLADYESLSNSTLFARTGVSTEPCSTVESPPALASGAVRGALAAVYSLAAGAVAMLLL